MVEIGVISPVLRRKAKVESEGKPKKADNEDEEDAEAAATAAEIVATKAAEAAKAITAASNRINARVVTEWTSALRGLLYHFMEYSHDLTHGVHIDLMLWVSPQDMPRPLVANTRHLGTRNSFLQLGR